MRQLSCCMRLAIGCVLITTSFVCCIDAALQPTFPQRRHHPGRLGDVFVDGVIIGAGGVEKCDGRCRFSMRLCRVLRFSHPGERSGWTGAATWEQPGRRSVHAGHHSPRLKHDVIGSLGCRPRPGASWLCTSAAGWPVTRCSSCNVATHTQRGGIGTGVQHITWDSLHHWGGQVGRWSDRPPHNFIRTIVRGVFLILH